MACKRGVEYIRISNMKRLWAKRVMIIGGMLVLAAAAGLMGWLWWQERQLREAMMNQVDYSLIAPDALHHYVQRDLGITLDDLKQKHPRDLPLGGFSRSFLAGRILVWAGEEKKALEYYQHAEQQLGPHAGDQDLRTAFYSRYVLLSPHMDESMRERVGKEYDAITGGSIEEK